MLTPAEKNVIWVLAHPKFNSKYLEELTERDISEAADRYEAMRIMEAKGFLECVRAFVKMPK